MSPEEAVIARLHDVTAVTDRVGAHIYMDKVPQGLFLNVNSAIVVQLVHEPTSYHQRGGQRDRARVQVDAYVAERPGVDPYAEVTELADAIHGDDAGSGLSGFSGVVGGSPSLRVTAILRVDRTRGYEAEERRLLRQRQDYWVHFKTN